MAVLEAHQELENHPNLFVLAEAMGWNKHEALGRLLAFWFWCLKYSPSGDLRRFNDVQLAGAVVLNSSDAKKWVDALVRSCWIDRGEGVFRVSNWLCLAGRYLRDTLYRHKPEEWQKVRELHQIPLENDVGVLSADSQPTVSRTSAESRFHGAVKGDIGGFSTNIFKDKGTEENICINAGAREGAGEGTNRPTLEQAQRYFKKMQDMAEVPAGERFTPEEIKDAWLSKEAGKDEEGYWMWGKRRAGDWRSVLEKVIRDQRKNAADRASERAAASSKKRKVVTDEDHKKGF